MPKCLKEFLEALPLTGADELWEWLDGNPEAGGDMIACILESHPLLESESATEAIKRIIGGSMGR